MKVRLWLLNALLRWYRRDLERQIECKKWDKNLSAKVDAILILLDE